MHYKYITNQIVVCRYQFICKSCVYLQDIHRTVLISAANLQFRDQFRVTYKGVHKIVNLKGIKRNSDLLLGYGCTWTFAKVSTSTYSLQVMISSKVEALGLAFHFCIANHFFSLSDQKFLRHRQSCVLLLLYWKIATVEIDMIIINGWHSSTNCVVY